MIFDVLSEKDKDTIEYYIEKNVGKDTEILPASLSHVLRHWAYNKQGLYRLFGNNLILKREIDVELTEKDKRSRMENASNKAEFQDFISRYREKVWSYFPHGEEARRNLLTMIWSENLSKNVWEGDNFSFINPVNNKKIQVQKGASIMKILGRLAREWELEEYFEPLRNAHSHIIGTNRLKGTLCLSIHPLDFMTMSDNDCGWTSCMSWTCGRGSCKQGTVEMMNSPDVIIAYLETSTPYDLGDGIHFWNNKMWRELYITNEDFLSGIKAYPFRSDALTSTVLNWLMELNGDWYYEKPFTIVPDEFNYLNVKDEKVKFAIEIETNHMYNDFFNNNPVVKMFLSNTLLNSAYDPPVKKRLLNWGGCCEPPHKIIDNIYYNYSGESQCVWCGESIYGSRGDNEDFELFNGMLACPDCVNMAVCESCHDLIDPDSEYIFEGQHMCEECFDNLVVVDDVLQEYVWRENTEQVRLISKELIKDMGVFSTLDTSILDNKGWELYFKEDYKYGIKEVIRTYRERYYEVCFEDLNERGLRLFGLYRMSPEGLPIFI